MNGISFTQRGFSGPVVVPGVVMAVERLEWRAVGGPWLARIRCTSESLARLWGLVDLLRCGVAVSDETAQRSGYLPSKAAEDLAWWGYVSGVEIHAGARVVKIGLDEMYNRIAVRYRPVGPLGGAAEVEYTAWVEDAESVRAFGEKEKYFYLGSATAGDAAAYASAMLEQLSMPKMKAGVDPAAMQTAGQPAAGPAGPAGAYYAILEGRGWWETLGWKYYNQERGRIELLDGGAEQSIGAATANTKIAFSITPGSAGWTASEAWLNLRKVGVPTDNLIVELCANSAGVPSTVLASKTLAASDLADRMTWTQFVFTSTADLAASGWYWLVVRRSGSVSASAYYSVAVNLTTAGAGYLIVWNGSAWGSRSPDADLSVMVSGVEESTVQIEDMLDSSAGGQFLAGARVSVDSGVYARLYRDGSRTAREEIEELLLLGQTSGARLLARIEASRRALVMAMPAESSAEVSIGDDGRIEHGDGRPLALSEQPAGRWARLGGLSTAGRLLGYAGAEFMERVSWDGRVLRYGA